MWDVEGGIDHVVDRQGHSVRVSGGSGLYLVVGGPGGSEQYMFLVWAD